LILEGDGRRWHARVRDFEMDRWRDSVAVAHGFAVQRFTYLHLTRRTREVSGLIAQAGLARAA
jgi:very-short-patch-repair endonuclease